MQSKATKPVGIARSLICLALASALIALPGCSSCRNGNNFNPPESHLPDRCFTKAPSLAKQKEIAQVLQARRMLSPMRSAGSVTIQVYFHVLTDDNGVEGHVNEAVLKNQIDVLNAAFSGTQENKWKAKGFDTPFRFAFAGMEKTQKDEWFRMSFEDTPSGAETAAKAALNRGGKAALNIYTARLADGPYGWTRWPWDFRPEVDGVVVSYLALPGGSATPYNLGDIVTHEVGHWLGLFHTFEGGCYGDGDFVADTWPEATGAKDCPITTPDTCTDSDFRDPINNFMDYTDDACIYKFTAGQADRMDAAHLEYRTP